jgi:hypothetical protein
MEEFDFNSEIEIGTQISQLKGQTMPHNIDVTTFVKETEIQLDKLKSTELPSYSKIVERTYKDNLSYNKLERDMFINSNVSPLEKILNVKHKHKKKVKPTVEITIYEKYHLDLIFYILLFIILNNKIIIKFIYDKIQCGNIVNNPHINLIVRTTIFAIIIFLFRTKYNIK